MFFCEKIRRKFGVLRLKRYELLSCRYGSIESVELGAEKKCFFFPPSGYIKYMLRLFNLTKFGGNISWNSFRTGDDTCHRKLCCSSILKIKIENSPEWENTSHDRNLSLAVCFYINKHSIIQYFLISFSSPLA